MIEMKQNIFNVKSYYEKLKKEDLIKEVGYSHNLKDNCIEYDYEIDNTLMKLRKFKDRTDILCGCKFHSLKNATHPESLCRAKNILTLWIIEQTENDL